MQNTFQSHVSTYLDATSQEYFIFVFCQSLLYGFQHWILQYSDGIKEAPASAQKCWGDCEFYL